MRAGIYVHIPFCVKKCAYCDFLSFPAGEEEMGRYVDALKKEIQSYKNAQPIEVPTIFLGGGTPSVLHKEQLEDILGLIFDVFSVDEDAEVTLEMNPGTVKYLDKNQSFLPKQVNRVSIGLQSVNNVELQKLGRIHTYEDFLQTYDALRNSGIKNINVDLISAIPDQTLASWSRTLETVAKLEPEHISAYSLIVEEGTPFAHMELNLPSEEEERQIYEQTEKILKEYGYDRYEISNYAKAGFECRHNISYWKRANYLGLGLGASSLIQNSRFRNTDSIKEYMENSGDPSLIQREAEDLSRQAQMEEFMFLGLRMMEGVLGSEFFDCFGETIEQVYGKQILKLKQEGLLEEKNGKYSLTARGVDISNYVMAEFLF